MRQDRDRKSGARIQIRVLGSGDKLGFPRLDCACSQCKEARIDASMQRTRTSILASVSSSYVLFDLSPDLRTQLLRAGVRLDQLTHAFITHAHGDHILGLYELFGTQATVEIAVHPSCYKDALFAALADLCRASGSVTFVDALPGQTTRIGDMVVRAFIVPHCSPPLECLGFAIGSESHPKRNAVYIPDIAAINDSVLSKLASLGPDDVLMIGADSNSNGVGSNGHMAIETIRRGLKGFEGRVVYIHASHSLDSAHPRLDDHECIAHDGLVFEL